MDASGPAASGAASGVQVHYDSQAHKHTNLRDALAARRAGVLFTYKRYANSVKRQLIQSHARDARLLIDIGCGRGGDIAKWRDARVHVRQTPPPPPPPPPPPSQS